MSVRTWPHRTILRRGQASGRDATAPLVTVIIPTCNRASLLPRAIESVLAQTFQDFEIVVVDDGSRDNTVELVAAMSNPRLRFVPLAKNQGASHARNIGIANARGEWVAFLDDDDAWLPGKLERQLARATVAGDSIDAVYCRFDDVRKDAERPSKRRPASAPPEGYVTDAVLTNKVMVVPSVYLMRRSALLGVGGFDESIIGTEDSDLVLRLAIAGHRFGAVPERLVIKDNDHELGRLTDDPAVPTRGFRTRARRWGALMRERMGVEEYRRWYRNGSRSLGRWNRRHVKQMMRSGDRARAWRYTRRMLPALPWGSGFVARALVVVVLGRAPYRLLHGAKRLRRRKRGREGLEVEEPRPSP